MPLQVGVVIAGLLLLVGATALPAQELYVIGLVVAAVSTYFGWI